MSDADDQFGGTGGEAARRPGGPPRSEPAAEASDSAEEARKDKEATRDSEQSFPASDPPGNY